MRRQTQEITRSIDALIFRSRDMATRMRDSVRGTYGRTAEMLVEFRLQPRRLTRPKPENPPMPPGTENAKPSGEGPTPARTAAPETDASTQE